MTFFIGNFAPSSWIGSTRNWLAFRADSATWSLLSEIQRDAANLTEEESARQRYEGVREKLRTLPGVIDKIFDREQVARALRTLGDDRSSAVADRIEGRAYRLIVEDGKKFEALVTKRREQEGHLDYAAPSTQNSVYFSEGLGGGPVLFARKRPLNLPWNLSIPDVFFQLVANVVHDDRHHLDLSEYRRERRGAPDKETDFRWELRAHAVEFLWRARQGDAAWLARFTNPLPSGFVASFRQYYERFYENPASSL